jgi:hypothetical protein
LCKPASSSLLKVPDVFDVSANEKHIVRMSISKISSFRRWRHMFLIMRTLCFLFSCARWCVTEQMNLRKLRKGRDISRATQCQENVATR